MRWFVGFLAPCSALLFTVGCELTGGGSGGGGDGIAERSNYTTIKKWDSATGTATLNDNFVLTVDPANGSVQRGSCSWENTVPNDFAKASKTGQLVYYRVYISKDFVPGEPLPANEFILVNKECYKANPEVCGPVVLP